MGTGNHKLGPLGAEPELPEMAQMFQDSLHKFSADYLRPIGRKLDRMTPEEAQAFRNWKGMDRAVAFHLIERHANGWNQAGLMMEAWLEANKT